MSNSHVDVQSVGRPRREPVSAANTRFPFLAQKLFNVPIAILPAKAEIVMGALADRLGIAHMFRGNGQRVPLGEVGLTGEPESDRPYDVISGIAVIPVRGTLVQELGSLRPYSGMSGYDSIRVCFLQALHDELVDAIVLDVNPAGGEVPGCFDLVDTIYASRRVRVGGKIKPIWAILAEDAFSAAYAIASAADRVTVPRTGGTGSVGVISMHVDFSKALRGSGITVTLIQHGDRKADGSDVAPLSDRARAKLQDDIDTVGELFVATVARNRRMSRDAVRATEATTYLGRSGLNVGFADAVVAPDAAFLMLLNSL